MTNGILALLTIAVVWLSVRALRLTESVRYLETEIEALRRDNEAGRKRLANEFYEVHERIAAVESRKEGAAP